MRFTGTPRSREGSELGKTCLCVIVSLDALNAVLLTVVVSADVGPATSLAHTPG
jgi:hypothetical protein